MAEITQERREILEKARAARLFKKHQRWAAEMRDAGWLVRPPFGRWLRNHIEDPTPIGDLARDVATSPGSEAWDRVDVRKDMERNGASDEAWRTYWEALQASGHASRGTCPDCLRGSESES